MARRSRREPQSSDERDKIRFARFTRLVINWVGAALFALFAYLQLKDLQAAAIFTPVASDILWRATLVIYYWCWVFGTSFDTDIQEIAYVSFPGKGRWPVRAFGVLSLFVVVAAVLLWSRGNFVYFSLALTVFVVV